MNSILHSIPLGVYSISSLTRVVQYYMDMVFQEYILANFRTTKLSSIHWPPTPPPMVISDPRVLAQIENYLDAGADPDVICEMTGARYFAMAIVLNSRELSRLFAEHGASWTIKDQFGPNGPMYPIFALLQTNPIHVHDLIPLCPIEVWKQLTPSHQTPLHVALTRDGLIMRAQHLTRLTQSESMAFALVSHLKTITCFWTHHGIDTPDTDGNTVLMVFCRTNYVAMCFRIIFAFLEHGHPEWNLQNKDGETALYIACGYNLLALNAVLTRPDMQFQIQNNHGFTPFLCLLLQQRYSRCLEVVQRHQRDLVPSLLDHTEWGSYLELIGYRSKNVEYVEIVQWMLGFYVSHCNSGFLRQVITHCIQMRKWKVLMLLFNMCPDEFTDLHRNHLKKHLDQGRCKFDQVEFDAISRFISS